MIEYQGTALLFHNFFWGGRFLPPVDARGPNDRGRLTYDTGVYVGSLVSVFRPRSGKNSYEQMGGGLQYVPAGVSVMITGVAVETSTVSCRRRMSCRNTLARFSDRIVEGL